MYDIVFLSFDEEQSDENWTALLARFPIAKRVHGIPGVREAHQEAARSIQTSYFWVVDADNRINDDFDFSYEWNSYQPVDNHVRVWQARNSVNNLIYGYGGIKLLPRQAVLDHNTAYTDFCTTISPNFSIDEQIASTSVINRTPLQAYRSGFREGLKLALREDMESKQRLGVWRHTGVEKPNGQWVIDGVKDGEEFAKRWPQHADHINDFAWMRQQYEARLAKI